MQNRKFVTFSVICDKQNGADSFVCVSFIRGGMVLYKKVRLPVLLCAVKTVESDFQLYWMISPNVGQTHKDNPNLVRIFYMTFTLNDIYMYK